MPVKSKPSAKALRANIKLVLEWATRDQQECVSLAGPLSEQQAAQANLALIESVRGLVLAAPALRDAASQFLSEGSYPKATTRQSLRAAVQEATHAQ